MTPIDAGWTLDADGEADAYDVIEVETRPTARTRCPACLAVFRTGYAFCPSDGTALGPTFDEPLLGATLVDRYVVEEVVGEGAMGIVYRARHVRLPRSFAIKVLFGDLACDPVMRLRFAQEAEAAAQLAHPNVVSVVDFGKTERGLLHLVMDFVEGEQLGKVIAREGPLAAHRVVALGRALACGLAHAHGHGLVHRDFKPDNVVLEPHEDGSIVPRILDFGLAISAREGDIDGRLTQEGLVVGTPIYLSPEQARGAPVDHRADLFALGIVLYEMLAGKPPFDGTSVELAHKNMMTPVPLIALRTPGVVVPPGLEAIVRRLVAKDPDRRFQTADELVRAFDELAGAAHGAVHAVHDERGSAPVPVPVAAAPSAAAFVDDLDDVRYDVRSNSGRWFAATAALFVAAGFAYFVAERGETSGEAVATAPAPAVPPAVAMRRGAPVDAVAAAPAPAPEPALERTPERRPAPASARRAGPPPARVASAAPVAATPAAVPGDVPTARLVADYRSVGKALDELDRAASPRARALRDRYFRLRFADALRMPALRRDVITQLNALRSDIRDARDP